MGRSDLTKQEFRPLGDGSNHDENMIHDSKNDAIVTIFDINHSCKKSTVPKVLPKVETIIRVLPIRFGQ